MKELENRYLSIFDIIRNGESTGKHLYIDIDDLAKLQNNKMHDKQNESKQLRFIIISTIVCIVIAAILGVNHIVSFGLGITIILIPGIWWVAYTVIISVNKPDIPIDEMLLLIAQLKTIKRTADLILTRRIDDGETSYLLHYSTKENKTNAVALPWNKIEFSDDNHFRYHCFYNIDDDIYQQVITLPKSYCIQANEEVLI